MKVRAADARVLPDGVSARVGALMEPLANGVHAVRLAPTAASRAPSCSAPGTIGLVTLQAALLEGILHVAVVEPQDERRARAAALGAHAVYATPEEAKDAGEPDLVLDAVGAQATRALGLELLRPGGTLVCIGLAADDTTLGFHGVIRSPAPHPGLLRVHDARLRAGARVAGERRRRRSVTTCPRCARSRTGRSSSHGSPAARRHPSSRSSWRHEPRCVVVIGASSGIGLATARAFRDAGDSVHAAARRDISEPGIAGHTLDFTDHHAVANFAAPFERVDALIISAGTNIKERRLHELTPDAWDRMVAANLNGPFYAIHSFLPKLKAARGTVVIISSVSGAYTDRSGPAYQAAKSGAIKLSHGAGFESGGDVRFTVILPGRRRHRHPRQPPRAADARGARPDAARRGRRGGVRVRRRPAAARLRGRADDPADGAAGDREDALSGASAITRASRPRAAGVEALDHVHAELPQQRARSPRPRRTRRSSASRAHARRGWSDSRITRSDGLVALWRTNSPSILR